MVITGLVLITLIGLAPYLSEFDGAVAQFMLIIKMALRCIIPGMTNCLFQQSLSMDSGGWRHPIYHLTRRHSICPLADNNFNTSASLRSTETSTDIVIRPNA